MDIAQMRMILVLAECQSMTTTAKKLHVTQPALTYQLKVIENELGFKVFNRTRQGTTLTTEGAFFRETVESIVSEYDESVRLARAVAKGAAAGTIRVGINDSSRDTVSFLLSMAPSAMTFSFIPCGSSDPLKLLNEGVIDFWSTSDAALAEAPDTLKLASLAAANQLVFVPADHHLASRESLHVQDLRNETVWLWPRGSVSAASDAIRDELEELGTDVADFVPGVPAIVTAFMDEGVAVYDDGYLPPPAQAAVQIPLVDADADVLGLAYLAAQEERLTPIIHSLQERMPYDPNRASSDSERVAERIVSVLDEISSTVRRGGMKDIVPLVDYALDLGVSANHLLNRGLLAGMNATGEAYRKGEIFMSEMMAAVATTNLAMETLQPHLESEDERPLTGSAVIGTIMGDKHDIGKNLVRIMLESRDINVSDLGTSVPPEDFVEHVRNNADCNLVLVSVNRAELLDNVRDVIEAFEAAKLRERVFIMVGGGAASPEFARKIGADAFTYSAEDAAAKAREFMSV